MNDLIAMQPIAHQLVAECRKEEASARSIEKILSNDPALSAKILRVVNSPYYGLPRQVKNLGQATIVLGIQQIRNLSIGVLAYSSLNSLDPRVQKESQLVWAHSLETALAAQMVAENLGLDGSTSSDAFLVGLLHEVGRMFMLNQFTGPYLHLLELGHVDDEQEIATTFGATTYQASALLLDRWKLPEEISRAVLSMGDPVDMTPLLHSVIVAHDLMRDLDSILPSSAVSAGLGEEDAAEIRRSVSQNARETRTNYGLAS